MEKQSAVTALAQESRLAVFRLLVQTGPSGLAAGKISETLGISPSSLSFHLKEPSYAGPVASRQESRFVIYAAIFGAMNELLAFLTENCCGGQACGTGAAVDCSSAESEGEPPFPADCDPVRGFRPFRRPFYRLEFPS